MSDQEVRELKWKLKQAHQQIGRQGDTIYNLRGNVAELHSLISHEARGVYRRIQAQYDDLYGEHQQALQEIDRLREKLDEREQVSR
jgi:Mg2+ and Co2+ transporter CorA